MEDKKITMPAVALRGLTILPGMVQHFDISREKSVKAGKSLCGNALVTGRFAQVRDPPA